MLTHTHKTQIWTWPSFSEPKVITKIFLKKEIRRYRLSKRKRKRQWQKHRKREGLKKESNKGKKRRVGVGLLKWLKRGGWEGGVGASPP